MYTHHNPTKRSSVITLLLATLLATSLDAGAKCGNPIVNDAYSADPAAHVFRDTLWLTDIPLRRKAALIAGSVREVKIPAKCSIQLAAGATRQQLQQALDSCSQAGGGTVTLQRGEYMMDGTVNMRSDVQLHLADGAHLRFSSDPNCYLPPVLTRWEGTELYSRSSMIHALAARNFAITGEGDAIIDAGGELMARWGMPGGDPNFKENVHGTHGETPETADVQRLRQMGSDLTPVSERTFGKDAKLRPCAIEFNDCSQILLQGFTLTNSPFWCIHPLYCSDVTVRQLTIDSHFPNNDGCDPESSRRVLIEDCTFRTGDDAIAVKSGRDADGRRVGRPSEDIVIRHCRFFSQCNGLCIGSEMSGGVRNVYMTDIEIGNVKNALLFKSNLDRGGFIENVFVDSVSIGDVAGAVLRFETNYFGYRGGHFPANYSHFSISNVSALSSQAYAIYYDGNADAPITDIRLDRFCVGKAPHPYYLYHTSGCTFTHCSVGGQLLPTTLPESTTRRQCDVW